MGFGFSSFDCVITSSFERYARQSMSVSALTLKFAELFIVFVSLKRRKSILYLLNILSNLVIC